MLPQSGRTGVPMHRLTVKTLLLASAVLALTEAQGLAAETTATTPASDDSVQAVVVSIGRTTRSAVSLDAVETQKLLPGINPLKAIQTLPGVLLETADPWGNNEQNESLFVHGFNTQQLGYTLDGVPLGDQQYGNYNGLSVSRAVTSENVGRVELSSGAGALGVASTSNLGGAIETYSRDPSRDRVVDVRETLGDYRTNRTFLRLDTGEGLLGGAGYISYLHQDAKAWDFDGHQKGDQVNVKYVHDDAQGKLTLYADWQDKVEPNEDATAYGNAQSPGANTYPYTTSTYFPYTRPFIYPNYQGGLNYLTAGAPPAATGNNFTNYFSLAQRTDLLGYARYDWNLSSDLKWSNTAYYHYNYGRGIVAGPVNQAGLPGLFATYYPGQNLVNVFGGTGYEVRTTEYRINREGLISNLNWTLGAHNIEAGIWYEHNESAQHRVWYPFSAANDDLTPYSIPRGPAAFIQYYIQLSTDDVQLHLQDQWRITPTLLLQAGFKSSLQTASSTVPINQQNLPSVAVPTVYPTGSITSNKGFLPQLGAVWDATDHEQVFANIQQNMRQFIPYGAGSGFYGVSPWSLGSQAAFDAFKASVNPETSWTYELGVRSHRPLELGLLTSFDGQASVYHVNFSDRLLNIAAYNFINPGAAVIVNVGGVTTDGVDLAGTLNFGQHVHFYDAVSYNSSTYDSSYSTAAKVNGVLANVVIPTAGKTVPLTPDWMNKFILSGDYGPFEAQLNGDYVGRRYAEYLNQFTVKGVFTLGLEASYRIPVPVGFVARSAKISLNVTNLNNAKGVSTIAPGSVSVTSTGGLTTGYSTYPVPPRMAFITLAATF